MRNKSDGDFEPCSHCQEIHEGYCDRPGEGDSTELSDNPLAMALLVNLAQRVRMARRHRRALRGLPRENESVVSAYAAEYEAWNSFQAAKALYNRLREENDGS